MIFSSRSLIKITILTIAIWVMPATLLLDLKETRDECKEFLRVIFHLEITDIREVFWDTDFFINPSNFKSLILTTNRNMMRTYFKELSESTAQDQLASLRSTNFSDEKLKTNMIEIANEYLEFVKNVEENPKFSESVKEREKETPNLSNFVKHTSIINALPLFCEKKITDNASVKTFAESLIK